MKRQRMSGKVLQDAAVEVARSKGYLCAHFNAAAVRPGRFVTPYSYDSCGFPDLVLVGPSKTVVVEVKGDGDSMSEAQKLWLAAFQRAGVETLILTSRAWRAGELEALL